MLKRVVRERYNTLQASNETYKSVRTIKVILSYTVIMTKYTEVAKVLTEGCECETGENKGLHTEESAAVFALVAAVFGPFPVHGSRTVAAVENAWEEFGEVTLAEAQRWRCAFN